MSAGTALMTRQLRISHQTLYECGSVGLSEWGRGEIVCGPLDFPSL